MSVQVSDTSVARFIYQVHSSSGEMGHLIRLAGKLRQQWAGPAKKGSLSKVQRACIDLLSMRMAELSQSADQTAREAAMTIGRIGKAFQEQKAKAETVRQFGPILAVLQKRIDHSLRKVQAAKTVVGGLTSLVADVESKGAASAAGSEPKSQHAPPKRPAAGRKD
jgi:hypothetical protein